MAEALRLPFYCSMLTSIVASSALRTHNCQLGALPVGPNSCTHKLYPSPRSHSLAFRHKNTKSLSFELNATVTETEQPKWWEKNAPNMVDIHSTEEFLKALSEGGDRLVIVEFYGTWCASCRALFPKLCKTAAEHPDILFLKVNFDENKPMCKSMNVKVLPYFHFYRGADGRLESFSCSLAKFQKIKDAIETHNTARCSIGPPMPIDLKVESSVVPKDGPGDQAQS